MRARSERGEKEKALHRNCAKKRTEEETCARDSAQAAEAPWRRRIRAGGCPRTRWGERVGKTRRRRKCAVNALGEYEKEKALHRNCAKKRTEEETFA